MIQNDSKFLQSKGLMDYSLLLFIETKKSSGGRNKESSINNNNTQEALDAESSYKSSPALERAF